MRHAGESLVDNGLDFGWGGLGVRLNTTSAFASITDNVDLYTGVGRPAGGPFASSS